MHPYVCYCLESSTTAKTYVGVTNNLKRRLRQHNRELQGGAKYTSTGGPWILSILVGPFATHQHALHFEWHWKHSPPKKVTGLKGRLIKLQHMVTVKTPWPLQVYALNPELLCHRTMPEMPGMPPSVTVVDNIENILGVSKK